MKVILTIFLSLTAQYSLAQNVEIKLFNKTEHDIKNLSYSGKDLGTLRKNNSITFRTDSLQLYFDCPLGSPDGAIDGIKITSIPGSVSGKNVRLVREGIFVFNVVLTKHNFPENAFTLDFQKRKK